MWNDAERSSELKLNDGLMFVPLWMQKMWPCAIDDAIVWCVYMCHRLLDKLTVPSKEKNTKWQVVSVVPAELWCVDSLRTAAAQVVGMSVQQVRAVMVQLKRIVPVTSLQHRRYVSVERNDFAQCKCEMWICMALSHIHLMRWTYLCLQKVKMFTVCCFPTAV